MKCKVEGCEGKYKTKGYCAKHYQQIRRGGKILERTFSDKNEYSIHLDVAFIYVETKGGIKIIIVDFNDLARLIEYKWCIVNAGTGYARNGTVGFMHRFILNLTNPNQEVDHINHNTLDNRKSNLRVCSRAENCRNYPIPKHNSSGYKGVYENRKRWAAKIMVNREPIYLGTYNTPEEASQAYDIAAKALHKDFALTNSTLKENNHEM